MCPAGYWTEGYGSLVLDDKGNRISGSANKRAALLYSKIHTVEQAIGSLNFELTKRWQWVDSLKLTLTENQQVALVSLSYNIGFPAFVGSTLLKKIKSKSTNTLIDVAFRAWNKGTVNGKKVVLKGLDARRTTESLMFITGELKFFN